MVSFVEKKIESFWVFLEDLTKRYDPDVPAEEESAKKDLRQWIIQTIEEAYGIGFTEGRMSTMPNQITSEAPPTTATEVTYKEVRWSDAPFVVIPPPGGHDSTTKTGKEVKGSEAT